MPAQRVSGVAQQFVSHLRDLRQQKLFAYLTGLAVVMIIINIVQAILIDHMHSMIWATVFPGVVLGLSLGAIAINGVLSREKLGLAWKDATVPRRIAWIGATASILLPILICQFLYMPLVAIPAWHESEWTTKIEPLTAAHWPAVNVAADWIQPLPGEPKMSAPLSLSRPWCWVTNPSKLMQKSCRTSNLTYLPGGMSLGSQSFTLNPLHQDNAAALSSGNSVFASLITIEVPFIFNSSSFLLRFESSSSQLVYSNLRFSIFDPWIPLKEDSLYLTDPEAGFIKGSAIINTIPASLSTDTSIQLTIQGSGVYDKARVLPAMDLQVERNWSQPIDYIFPEYFYYEAQVTTTQAGSSLPHSRCDVASPNYHHNRTCSLILTIRMLSPLFTTQSSSHGTTPLKILIDEGSILGAIFFLTWFAGIFII